MPERVHVPVARESGGKTARHGCPRLFDALPSGDTPVVRSLHAWAYQSACIGDVVIICAESNWLPAHHAR